MVGYVEIDCEVGVVVGGYVGVVYVDGVCYYV